MKNSRLLLIGGIIAGWLLTLGIILFFFWNPFSWKIGEVTPSALGDSFGIVSSMVSIITFLLVYETFFEQKKMNKIQETALDSQSQDIRDQKFRDFIKFLLEGLSRAINNIHVTGNYQGSRIFKGEDACILIKYNAIRIDGNTYTLSGDKTQWLKHGGEILLKRIIKHIAYIEGYINNNYGGKNIKRKQFYIDLIKNEIGAIIFELLMEVATESDRDLITFKEFT